MYYEIEGRFNMKDLLFDDEKLTVGAQCYPYPDIQEMTVTGGQLFSVYGILQIRLRNGRLVSVPYARSAGENLRRAIREFERLQDQKEIAFGSFQGRSAPASSGMPDPYEEARKLKELLDLGIVTEEEFQRKKKEILGL